MGFLIVWPSPNPLGVLNMFAKFQKNWTKLLRVMEPNLTDNLKYCKINFSTLSLKTQETSPHLCCVNYPLLREFKLPLMPKIPREVIEKAFCCPPHGRSLWSFLLFLCLSNKKLRKKREQKNKNKQRRREITLHQMLLRGQDILRIEKAPFSLSHFIWLTFSYSSKCRWIPWNGIKRVTL